MTETLTTVSGTPVPAVLLSHGPALPMHHATVVLPRNKLEEERTAMIPHTLTPRDGIGRGACGDNAAQESTIPAQGG